MLRYSDVILQPLKDHKFKLIKSLKYKDITVPAGFRTDGASVPRVFWSFFPPNRTDYLPCAVIHDYLCNLKQYDKADRYFKECLEELKVKKLDRCVMYHAVKIYHTLKYKWLRS